MCGSLKNKTPKYFFLLLAICCCSALFPQRIINFNVTPANNTVNTRFTLTAGPTCYGYKIMHSLDSLTFTQVYDFAGICGASGSAETFSDIHTTPAINQMNYYKIQLSTFETSEVKKIFVGTGTAPQILVIPNPVFNYTDEVKFKLIAVSNKRVQGFIYDLSGNQKLFIDQTTISDTGVLSVNSLSDGLYVLWLTDGEQAFKGKFIIKR